MAVVASADAACRATAPGRPVETGDGRWRDIRFAARSPRRDKAGVRCSADVFSRVWCGAGGTAAAGDGDGGLPSCGAWPFLTDLMRFGSVRARTVQSRGLLVPVS